MKFNKKKILAQVAIATTLLSSAGAAVLGSSLEAYAADEEVIWTDAVTDNHSNRSLTLWKYQVKDASELGNRGDGTFDPTVDKDVIPGIKFKVQRVTPIAGGESLKDPREQENGKDYTIDGTFAEQVIETNGEGKAVLDLGVGRTNDGIYLVTELPDDRTGANLDATDGKKVGMPADPFFVYVPQTNRTDTGKLIYDVQVQPKNILESFVILDKTIKNEKGHSIQAGKDFEWELTAKIPAGLWQVASQSGKIDIYGPDEEKPGEYKIVGTYDMVEKQPIVITDGTGLLQPNFSMTDKLDSQLTYNDGSAKVQVKKGDTGAWEDLATGDYTVSFDAATNTLKTTLTEAGLTKVGTTSNGYTDIQTIFTTKVAEGWNGILDNDFTIDYQIPGQKPKTVSPPPETKPKYYTGGFDIEKTGEDTKAALEGAEFMIALSKEDAEAGKFLASDGEPYAKGATLEQGVTFQIATSDASGRAEFNGLALDWEDTNKDKIVQEDEVSRTYWVVETKAPDGYELLGAPVEVKVDLSTADNTLVELDIVDKPKVKLPFTGGTGTTLMVAIALGAITIGTVAITVDKKRRQA